MAVDVKPDPQALGENPLIEGLERLPVPATTLTIFGVTGDLAHRKLLPALYNLAHEGALPERFNLVGVARREMPDDEFRAMASDAIKKFSRREPDATVLEGLLGRMRYVGFSFDDVPAYDRLSETLDRLDEEGGGKLNRNYYLSTAPEYFPVIVQALKDAGLNYDPDVDVRVIIEKPFGTDLESALSLQQVVDHAFREQQVYRIDHYLGKETVQNVMAFRFANFMFEPVWNRNYIEHIQITAAEDIGIGTRAGYYDSVRRPARPRAEPHAPAADAGLHGAARVVRGRQGPRREGQGPAGDHAADAGGGPARHRARAVRRRHRGRRGGRRLPAGGRRPARTRAPRPTRRCAWRSTTGAGPACRSTCAPASTSRAR